jgi:hypothetical protein
MTSFNSFRIGFIWCFWFVSVHGNVHKIMYSLQKSYEMNERWVPVGNVSVSVPSQVSSQKQLCWFLLNLQLEVYIKSYLENLMLFHNGLL